ncbi:STELLO glycosyltransferase family protein [Cyclobacterium amurskyense]|uniref:STELLO glycosyltransferase family protein n=1 Tax=Cyclobacterium amurskyense TaxID=320787 RepID=UPI0030D78F90|tara:strand:+ start:179 stop:1180 length:1002 start_codon:yes stop_codon:yes gene_type:complete
MIVVVTTIASPTKSMIGLSESLQNGNRIIVIGDKKGPNAFDLRNADFYSLNKQQTLNYSLAKILPVGHYSRKNLGYLLAMSQGEKCIYETDDDNQPNNLWKKRSLEVKALQAKNDSWVNVYAHFSDEKIWPRGFLLDRINCEKSLPSVGEQLIDLQAPIQQGLADNSPDVDAIWRLVADRPFYFQNKPSIALAKGAWCPFNTQSTWWWEAAFPLLYLPSFCSFRMTDIWKSFIAQRCLWEMGHSLVFHAPEVVQDRNEHNLMRDFEAEISGYLQNKKLTGILEELPLLSGTDNVLDNMITCYEALVKADIFPLDELGLVYAWANDLKEIQKTK